DFWSTAIFLDELIKVYAAELSGQSVALPPPRSSYAEFTRRQAEMVESEEGDRHWAYWNDELADLPTALDLPTDFARPTVPSYRGATRYLKLDAGLTNAVFDLAESCGVSLYTILLAAFQVLLARLSGRDDIVIGTPASGRTRSEFQRLFGYFVNLLP